jgi:tRNA G10  N-methylase Trm11
MVRCAAIEAGGTFVDPFCGSGTLILEALDFYEKKLNCYGLDVSRRSVEGARGNAEAEGFGNDICQWICSDARGLRKHLGDDTVDAIVTNLPWGVMTGAKNVTDLQNMYEIFLRSAWYILKPGARIVVLVLRGLQMVRIIRKLSGRYRLVSVNVVRTTNNLPCIVVVEKLAEDKVRESLKGQLAYLNKYVNFSPEMYEAINMEDIDKDEGAAFNAI